METVFGDFGIQVAHLKKDRDSDDEGGPRPESGGGTGPPCSGRNRVYGGSTSASHSSASLEGERTYDKAYVDD